MLCTIRICRPHRLSMVFSWIWDKRPEDVVFWQRWAVWCPWSIRSLPGLPASRPKKKALGFRCTCPELRTGGMAQMGPDRVRYRRYMPRFRPFPLSADDNMNLSHWAYWPYSAWIWPRNWANLLPVNCYKPTSRKNSQIPRLQTHWMQMYRRTPQNDLQSLAISTAFHLSKPRYLRVLLPLLCGTWQPITTRHNWPLPRRVGEPNILMFGMV